MCWQMTMTIRCNGQNFHVARAHAYEFMSFNWLHLSIFVCINPNKHFGKFIWHLWKCNLWSWWYNTHGERKTQFLMNIFRIYFLMWFHQFAEFYIPLCIFIKCIEHHRCVDDCFTEFGEKQYELNNHCIEQQWRTDFYCRRQTAEAVIAIAISIEKREMLILCKLQFIIMTNWWKRLWAEEKCNEMHAYT